MSTLTYSFKDINFKESQFHEFIAALTSKVCENLKARIERESLATHLNHLLFASAVEEPDLSFLNEIQDYCEEFSVEISEGNADLILEYVYLAPDLTPHWAFRINIELSDTCEVVFLVDATEDKLCELEFDCYQDDHGMVTPLNIHSDIWTQARSKLLEFKSEA